MIKLTKPQEKMLRNIVASGELYHDDIGIEIFVCTELALKDMLIRMASGFVPSYEGEQWVRKANAIARKQADKRRNDKDRSNGIIKVNLRIHKRDKAMFMDLARESRERKL